MGARIFVTRRGLYLSGGTQQGAGFRIGRLENQSREVFREMDDMLVCAARDFKVDARHRQDIENEIAIRNVAGAYWRRRPSSSRIPETSAIG